MSGNTQACRTKHLDLAKQDAKTHCPHASPNGGGQCTEQKAFCNLYTSTCSSSTGYVAYNSDCVAQFGAFAAGTKDEMSGNTQACRTKHLDLAKQDAKTHCPHASPNGGGQCTEQKAFCNLYTSTCSSSTGYVAYNSDCVAQFGAFAAGTKDEMSGDTQACRTKHLNLAKQDADTHCPHASPNGGGTCVQNEVLGNAAYSMSVASLPVCFFMAFFLYGV